MPVISSEGLVGQIWRGIDGRYNDVLLTVDRRSSIDVVIQRTGARGVLEVLVRRLLSLPDSTFAADGPS